MAANYAKAEAAPDQILDKQPAVVRLAECVAVFVAKIPSRLNRGLAGDIRIAESVDVLRCSSRQR